MLISEAIDIAVKREDRPHEDDWEAIEALEVLASEVAKLQKIMSYVPAGIMIVAKEKAGFPNHITLA